MKTLQFGFLTRGEELYEKGGGAFFLCCCAFPKKILRTLMARGLLCVIPRLEGFNIMGISTASAFSFFGRKWCSSCRNLESKSNRSKRCQWRKTRFFDWVWYSYGTHNIIAFFPASFQDEMQNIRECKVWERGRGKHVLFSYTSCKTEIHLLSQKTRFGVFLRRLLVQNPCRSRWLFFWIMVGGFKSHTKGLVFHLEMMWILWGGHWHPQDLPQVVAMMPTPEKGKVRPFAVRVWCLQAV